MKNEFTDLKLEPPRDTWVCRRLDASGTPIAELRQSARRRFAEQARAFVRHLQQIAEDSGLSGTVDGLLDGDPDLQPIVMTGHQPSIFHSGLVFKYHQTELFAAEQNAMAAAVIIDSDDGDPGAFAYPALRDSSGAPIPVTATASFARAPGLFPKCELKSADKLDEMIRATTAAIASATNAATAAAFQSAASDYLPLQTASVMEANLIVRRRHGIGSRLLELPLASFARFPEVRTLVAHIVTHASQFAETHNRLLEEFRAEHRIRNAANPFPNLGVEGDQVELPLWFVDSARGVRTPLTVTHTGGEFRLSSGNTVLTSWSSDISAQHLSAVTDADHHIIPRGALITCLMRLLVSDLFLHGTGGGKYDQFTERLMATWWDVTPSPFVVASASRYLFHDERAELERLLTVTSDLRDLSHNPQRKFGTGVFSLPTESRLLELTQQKSAAVEELQQLRRAGQSGRDIGRTIQQLSNQIREVVEAEFQPARERLAQIPPASQSTITSRTWPWMLFPHAGAS